jgi:hypothetical protein
MFVDIPKRELLKIPPRCGTEALRGNFVVASGAHENFSRRWDLSGQMLSLGKTQCKVARAQSQHKIIRQGA